MTRPQVLAIRYAHRDARRAEHFYGSVENPDASMPISYFVWLIVGESSTVLVDTGFTAAEAERRGRTYVMSPNDAVRALGVDPESIDTVVLTHLHYDHAGCAPAFPAARFVLQEQEMAFWTGRFAARLGTPHRLVVPEDVTHLAEANFEGRVVWADGHQEVAPGIAVHRVGGHTPGMQAVTVETALGTVVLASDASHFYENFQTARPYSIVTSVPDALAAFDTIYALTSDPGLIVPGHDPAVLDRFPPYAGPAELAGHVVQIA